ncbi:MAG: 4-hydroxy-tetrahydrodipicolinate reductase [Paludibacteraceae bacterium]|nr:4-hydroxy-tetrahydrodipicolinate reductase [Paludibacteraceae bacterium]
MKIALIGYGKMGHMIEQIALSRGHEIVCKIESKVESQKSKDEGLFGPEGFDSPAFASADVAIEFTTPATAKENILRAWQHNVPVVCGTTGWNVEEFRGESLEFRGRKGEGVRIMKGKRTMLVWKSNFSIGVNVLFELNKQLAALLAPYTQYTPSITEVHHIHKIDKPSGTAVTLKEGLTTPPVPLSKGENAQCTMRDVPIESIREGEVAGIHTVTWDSPEDTIEIKHIAKGRQGFALGAVLAAEQLIIEN